MFKSVDMLIGFTVVMLVASMAVTLFTQFAVAVFNTRGVILKQGISELLEILDSKISAKNSVAIADHILRNPLVSAPYLFSWRRLAPLIQREELTKLLLNFAIEPAPAAPGAGPVVTALRALWTMLWAAMFPKSVGSLAELKTRLKDSLAANGVNDPAATLAAIRAASMTLERAQPLLSNSARTNMAILQSSQSDFVGKLNGWFDQTIDRASEAFTGCTRVVTLVGALVVAIWLQLDAVKLVNRLSTDDATRSKLVDWAVQHPEKFDPAPTASGKPPAVQVASPKSNATGSDRPTLTESANDALESDDLFDVPGSFQEWRDNWSNVSIAGVALSVLLLSLGAPFWYEILKNLLKFRSILTGKDDAERGARQSNQAPA